MLIWGPKIANLPQFGQNKNFLIKKHLVFLCLLNGWTEQNSYDPPAELRVQKAGRVEIDKFALIRLILEKIGDDPLIAFFLFCLKLKENKNITFK